MAEITSRMALSISTAKASFLPEEHIPLRISLQNGNSIPVAIYEMRKGFMEFTLTNLQSGVQKRCSEPVDLPRQIQRGRFYSLQPGASIDKSVYLEGFCKGIEAGNYLVDLSYRIPLNFDGYSFGYQAFVGELRAQTRFTVIEAKARANLALNLDRPRLSRSDQPLPLQITLRNYGPDAVLVQSPLPPTLDLRVSRDDGTLVSCRAVMTRLVRQGAFRTLAAGQSVVEKVNLAELCDLTRAGEYTLEASFTQSPSSARGLNPAQKRQLFEGSLQANRLPFTRESAAPRVKVVLEARALASSYYQNTAVSILVRARNLGPDVGAFAPPVVGWLDAELFGPARRRYQCTPPSRGGPSELLSTARAVKPSTSLDANIDLLTLCPSLSPGHYRVVLHYALPPTDLTVNGWGIQRLPVWSGEAKSQAVEFDVLPVPEVQPPQRPSPSPFGRPNYPPHAATPAQQLPPLVSLRAPAKNPRAGDPIELTLFVQAPTTAPYFIANPQPWMVTYTLRDQWGRSRNCRAAVSQSGLPNASAYSELSGGRTLPLRMDLAMACGLREAGTWVISAQLFIPTHFDGRQAGRGAFTGTVAAGSVTVRVKKAKDHSSHSERFERRER